MGKKLNEKVTNGKTDRAKKAVQMAEVREMVTDFIGDTLANNYSNDSYLVEVANGGNEQDDGTTSKVTKKKYLYITLDGVQIQIQVTAKEKPVVLTDDNVLATYTPDTDDSDNEEEGE